MYFSINCRESRCIIDGGTLMRNRAALWIVGIEAVGCLMIIGSFGRMNSSIFLTSCSMLPHLDREYRKLSWNQVWFYCWEPSL